MPHFDEDDRDEVFEKDSKESKEFKENGEEMDVDVDDDQSNGHNRNTKSQNIANNDHNKENSAVLQELLMKKEAEMKMETDAMNNTNGQDQDDEITKGVLAKLSSEILVTPKAEAKIDMKFLPKVTPNGEKLNIFNHTSNLNMTMSSVILNGENFCFFSLLNL